MPISQFGHEYESRHAFTRSDDDDEVSADKKADKVLMSARKSVREERAIDPKKPPDVILCERIMEALRADPALAKGWRDACGTEGRKS